MEEQRDEKRPDEEQDVEAHKYLSGKALRDAEQVDDADDDVEGHSPPIGAPPVGEPPVG